MIVGRSKAGCLNGTLLGVLPVVVSGNEIAVTVYQQGSRISRCAVHPNLGEGRPESADDQLDAAVAATGAETADQDMITRADKAADGNVCQPRRSGIHLE